MNEKIDIDVKTLKPFTRILMTIGQLPTSYLMSMSYYEQIVWFTKYLQEVVIPTINNNASAVEEVQRIVMDLQEYINNYFDNLDVQEEINNKLDEMVEDGTLESILLNYANLTKTIDTCENMKLNESLIKDNIVKTLGYYNINDGGEATYIIRESQPSSPYYEELTNGLYAEMIIKDNTINILSLGAKRSDGINKYDISEYINIYNNSNDKYILYIPKGAYYCSPISILKDGFSIKGDKGFSTDEILSTTISTYTDNQSFIFRIGNNTKHTYAWNIDGITLSSADYMISSNKIIFNRNVVKQCTSIIEFKYAHCGLSDNLYFAWIKGTPFKMCSSWENTFNLLGFRYISNIGGQIMLFQRVDTTLLTSANLSANNFKDLIFESTNCDLIKTEEYSGLLNSHFGKINFEPNRIILNNEQYTNYTREQAQALNDNSFTHLSVFNIGRVNIVVDSIELDSFASSSFTSNGVNYIYDIIVNLQKQSVELSDPSMNIKSISITNSTKDIRLLKNVDNTQIRLYSAFVINGLVNSSNVKCYFDVVKMQPKIYFHQNINDYATSTLPRIGNEATAFKDIARLYGGDTYGCLTYDSEASNDLQLCVTPYPNNFGYYVGYFLITDTKFMLRAKIPEGEEVALSLESGRAGHYKVLEMTGTGQFENYFFDLQSNLGTKLIIGDIVGIKFLQRSTSKNVLLDYFKCINSIPE